jgi:hypothetical protein
MDALLIQSLTVEDLINIVNDAITTQFEKHLKKQEKEIQYISRKEVAQILDCSLNTLDDWTVKGFLIPYRFGTTVKYIKSEVEDAGPRIVRRRKKGERHDR